MDITRYSAIELLQLQNAGQLSAMECCVQFQQVMATIENSPSTAIGPFLTTDFDAGIRSAIAVDRRRAAGETIGPLAGLPVAIKDCICTRGIRSTAASRMLEKFVPPFDAKVVQKIRLADGIIVGKTNMDEFAMGSSTENGPWSGTTFNPWNRDCVPGGSSGGSAAAVSSGMVPLALGSDTGGSIRQPAAFCGITGLKPTYGRVSRSGLIAFASSLDQIGPLAWTAADCALLLSVISGHDNADSTSARQPEVNYLDEINSPVEGLKIGVCREHLTGVDDGIATAVQTAVGVFQDAGAIINEISLPHSEYAVPAYYIVAPCEASSNLARYDGVRYTTRVDSNSLDSMYSLSRSAGFGPEVKRRILLGTFALSSGYYDQYYVRASKIRRLIKRDFDEAFKIVDVILGPTTPTTAFRLGERTDDPLKMYLADVFTVSANLAGIPAISIPCGFSSGLPIGLQLQGRAFDESTLLRAAHQYQRRTDWHARRPSR